ncbi:hypothetical protein AOLI_G00100540 [Acnodon oligacanthus]
MRRIEADTDESDKRVFAGFVSKQVDVFKETLERGCWCVLFTCLLHRAVRHTQSGLAVPLQHAASSAFVWIALFASPV